ncbi:MAG: GGDEF domain-containing protein [Oscillospiraceae bacterium]|nr:GGDEF domain-containing protein [Oscillospiraceae bacterium]
MKRKTIALFVTGFNIEYETKVAAAARRRCAERDINLLIFASLLTRPDLNSDRVLADSIIRGESEIFNLLNYDLVDGIIVLGESIVNERTLDDLRSRAAERGIPVVNVNDDGHTFDHNVVLSDKTAMEFVVEHLVTEHGFTKINFIGGFPGNLQTEERLAAYKKVLTAHNIPIEEDRIAYGKFWRAAADCTEQFLKAEELPQAIVCASDTMAFFCMDCLKSHGLRIPEDIAVTGFDGIKDCEAYKPTLTTAQRDFDGAGVMAVDIIADGWDGVKYEQAVSVNSKLIQHHSCGCPEVKSEEGFYDSNYGIINEYKQFNSDLIVMNTKFPAVRTSEELYAGAAPIAKLFRLGRVFICICKDVEEFSGNAGEDSAGISCSGLTDTMISMLQYKHDVPVRTEFPVERLVPVNILGEDKAVCFAFSPLYFDDLFLGYIAYEPPDEFGDYVAGDLFSTWTMAISNNAGSFYMKNELEDVVIKLENLYIRDPLTGLYNRRGMEKLAAPMIDEAMRLKKPVTVVCADIDSLKPINDLYGHEAGDNAIMQTAHALSICMPNDAVCVRTGGDEYCIILPETSGEEVSKCILHVEKLLSEYNLASGLPYKVGCSCGYFTGVPESLEGYEEIVRRADEEMYKVKSLKKVHR